MPVQDKLYPKQLNYKGANELLIFCSTLTLKKSAGKFLDVSNPAGKLLDVSNPAGQSLHIF